MLGCEDGAHWLFTGPNAVAAFLPQGGPAAVLVGMETDPIGAAGSLSGQLMAAKLSLGFDADDADFGASELFLGDLEYSQGPYEGWTVASVVLLADSVIGGCLSMDGSLSELVEALAFFNESFVDGATANPGWTLPGCGDDDGDDDDGPCEAVLTCSVVCSCPADTVLGCAGDPAVSELGWPVLEVTCCAFCPADSTEECTSELSPASWVWTDQQTGNCPTTITRTFSASIAVNGIDTALSCSQTIVLVDTVAPTLQCPPDLALECGDPLDPAFTGFASADDDCSTVVVAYTDFTLTSGAAGAEGISRFWTATDACGNTASCLQTITVPDATPPSLSLECPSDTTLPFIGECTAPTEPGMWGEPTVLVTDDVDAAPVVALTFEDLMVGGCAGVIVMQRVWSVTATDACDNQAVASCTQTITWMDEEPPVFANTCGLESGTQLEVCCSADGTIDIPTPCLVTASDNCGVTVDFAETYSSYAPMPGAQQACAAMEPVAYANGLTCEGDTTHVLRLFCFPGTDEQAAYFTAMGDGNIQYFDAATWTLSWTLRALDNPEAGFVLRPPSPRGWIGTAGLIGHPLGIQGRLCRPPASAVLDVPHPVRRHPQRMGRLCRVRIHPVPSTRQHPVWRPGGRRGQPAQ